MCYNCGCALPDEDHGIADNITNATFEKAAEALGQSPEAAREQTLRLLQKLERAAGEAS